MYFFVTLLSRNGCIEHVCKMCMILIDIWQIVSIDFFLLNEYVQVARKLCSTNQRTFAVLHMISRWRQT